MWNDERRKGNLPRTTNAFIERLIEKAKKTAALGPSGLRAVSPPRMCQTTLFQPNFVALDAQQQEHHLRQSQSMSSTVRQHSAANPGTTRRPVSAGRSEMREVTLEMRGQESGSSSEVPYPTRESSGKPPPSGKRNAAVKWEQERVHEVDLGSSGGVGTSTPILGPDGKIATQVVIDPDYVPTSADTTTGSAPIAPKRVRRKEQVQAIHEYISTHIDRHFGHQVEDPKHVELRKVLEQQNQEFSPEEYLANNRGAGGARYNSPTRLRQIEAQYRTMDPAPADARRATVTPTEFLSQQQQQDYSTDSTLLQNTSTSSQQPGPAGTREPMGKLIPQTKANIKRPRSANEERPDISDIAAQVCGQSSRITSTLKTMSPAPRPASATLIRSDEAINKSSRQSSLRPNRALPGSGSRPMSATKTAQVSQVSSSKKRLVGTGKRPTSSSSIGEIIGGRPSSSDAYIPAGSSSAGAGGKASSMDLAALGIVHIPDDLADLLATVE